MSFLVKVFLAFMVLSLGLVRLSVAQSDDPEVEWYDSFFLEEKQKSIDESLRIADSRLHDAIEKKDHQAEVKALIGLGLFHLAQAKDYEQALGWLIKSLTLEDSLGFKKERIFTYLAMAKVFEEVGNYNRSAELLKQARELNDSFSSPHLRALILNESGRINAL